MIFLIFGLAFFISVHLIPAFPSLRSAIIGKIKVSAYSTFFSLLSLISVVLIVIGLKQADFVALYNPPSWGRHLNMLLMFVALYFFASNTKGSAPSSVKLITAFPLSWALIIWATGHLLANGDLAHVVLFSSFLIYGVLSIISGRARGLKPVTTERPALMFELLFLCVIAIIYAGLFITHRYFTGMPLL